MRVGEYNGSVRVVLVTCNLYRKETIGKESFLLLFLIFFFLGKIAYTCNLRAATISVSQLPCQNSILLAGMVAECFLKDACVDDVVL